MIVGEDLYYMAKVRSKPTKNLVPYFCDFASKQSCTSISRNLRVMRCEYCDPKSRTKMVSNDSFGGLSIGSSSVTMLACRAPGVENVLEDISQGEAREASQSWCGTACLVSFFLLPGAAVVSARRTTCVPKLPIIRTTVIRMVVL